MSTVTLSIEYHPVADVAPAIRNPKAHDIDELRRSIARFGYVEPVMLDGRTDRLIAGHGRIESLGELAAAAEAADEDVAPPRGIHLVGGRWHLPVVVGWSSRDDAEAEAYIITSNRLPERGGWEQGLLATMLSELDAEVGLAGTGYDRDSLDDLLAKLGEVPEPEPVTFNPDERSAAGGEAHVENTYDQWGENYRNKQVRSMVFDYPLADFARISDIAGRARPAFAVESNAELFAALLDAWAEKNPAE